MALALGGRVGDISTTTSLALPSGRGVAIGLLGSPTAAAGASDVADLQVEALQKTLGALRTDGTVKLAVCLFVDAGFMG